MGNKVENVDSDKNLKRQERGSYVPIFKIEWDKNKIWRARDLGRRVIIK